MPKKPDKTCFVIAPIGKEGSEIRKWSDQVMELIIRPAGEECGFLVQRADDIQESGAITSQVIQRCAKADLVIANLTDNNPNVFYELALRHAVAKPVIQLIQKDQSIPFDIGVIRTLFYDKETPTSFLECRKELIEFIKKTDIERPFLDNPITSSLGLIELKSSSNPLEMATSEILSLLQDIQTTIKDMKSQRTKKRLSTTELYRDSEKMRETFKSLVEALRGNTKLGICELCQKMGDVSLVQANPAGSLSEKGTLLLCSDCISKYEKSGDLIE